MSTGLKIEANQYIINGNAYHRHYMTLATATKDEPLRMELTSMTGSDTFAIEPRYEGSTLDVPEDGGITCAFHHNGEYVALALFDREHQAIKVIDY